MTVVNQKIGNGSCRGGLAIASGRPSRTNTELSGTAGFGQSTLNGQSGDLRATSIVVRTYHYSLYSSSFSSPIALWNIVDSRCMISLARRHIRNYCIHALGYPPPPNRNRPFFDAASGTWFLRKTKSPGRTPCEVLRSSPLHKLVTDGQHAECIPPAIAQEEK
ncbi:hypothetical protein BO86DRAFT_174134 [Aspergillus japonicus CBS 114.51]|uniref:Uncharacterized protein n=1 Tax=Aspergillus japonicus CBS 114.51 TaxID=1448312 RepID=A0A8T8WSR9_ASPJA|nr:hypothetical protein BO86DRAFT_174134 [Aspergillus japonicus CBS 114.51]RAH78773.1 hypothetical protein BO86DRAFT_174134 [Aspergillus japonicus CBS 114.51]